MRDTSLRELLDVFVAEYGDMAVERLSGDESSYDRIMDAVRSTPFLSTRKLVVLKSPSLNKQFTDNIDEFLDNILETNDVIIVEPKLDKRLAYYKWLKKLEQFREFPLLDAEGVSRFAVEYVKQQGGTMSSADARYLVQRVGANQATIKQELDKLVIYDATITRQSIMELTEATPQSSIFDLVDAAFNRQTARAVQLYQEQRAQKVEPQQIVAMMAWQLYVLAIVKVGGNRTPDVVAREAKLNPFVIRKSQNLAQRISLSKLRELISSLRTIDTRMKSESVIPDELLKYYLLQLGDVV